ncbi:MAG TPA: transglutaminase domain-containing protein [Prolixibacteraceae bacterium]|jgi:hypothetical protein|nr:transglutaminase domain-containing protein [Prolixibacteraceae bacterium]
MKNNSIIPSLMLLAGLVIIPQLIFHKSHLPVIKANAITVDIRDGGVLKKSAWRILPSAKPDVYITHIKNSKVTFYTDLDSISFTVKAHEKYQFIILLNGKDSALTEIFYVPGFMDILKRAGQYNFKETRDLPKFTYQSADNPNLQSLRIHLKLDSIAGKGDEFSKVTNLLHWVHNLIRHDGQNGNPEIKNAESMIAVCKKEGRGLNCRGLAITLNECYLSLGFKSRYVTCLPKDSLKKDNDCHVINMVYLNSKSKWVWMDPTFNSYVMDEKGEPLSIEEVRERIIEDKPLVLNPEGNWNNKNPVVKGEYLFNYMAKNLYMLECPAASEYDSETAHTAKFPIQKIKDAQYIKLLPLEYFKQTPYKDGNIYLTNNSQAFWAKPTV